MSMNIVKWSTQLSKSINWPVPYIEIIEMFKKWECGVAVAQVVLQRARERQRFRFVLCVLLFFLGCLCAKLSSNDNWRRLVEDLVPGTCGIHLGQKHSSCSMLCWRYYASKTTIQEKWIGCDNCNHMWHVLWGDIHTRELKQRSNYLGD